jgi:hypothetical protein
VRGVRLGAISGAYGPFPTEPGQDVIDVIVRKSKDAVAHEGTVVEYNWENPHSHIIVKVAPGAADPATVGTWDIEGGATSFMGRQGWNRATYEPGDHIKVLAHPMKDGSKVASLFYAIMPDGTRLYHDIARPKTGEQ